MLMKRKVGIGHQGAAYNESACERVMMRWIRSNIRVGSCAALFALALQAVFSFGHVHLSATNPDALGQASVALAATADELCVALEGSRCPAQKSDGAVDAYCLICASIQLIANSAPSGEPALLLPADLGPIGLQAFAERSLAASPLYLFQARAPPSI